MTKADLLAAALDDFLAVSPDVEAAAVVSADGLPMASALPPYVEEDRLAAMSAALLTLGERAAAGLGKGELAQVFVEGAQGYVVLMSAGRNAVLVAVTSKETKVGLILYEMRKTSSRVASIMDEDVSADQLAQAAMDRAATAITTQTEAPLVEEPVAAAQPTTESTNLWTEPAPSEESAWDSATVVHEEFNTPESEFLQPESSTEAWDSEGSIQPAESFESHESFEPVEAQQVEESFQPAESFDGEESFTAEPPPPPPEEQPVQAETETTPSETAAWDADSDKDEKKETRVTGWT